jgi:hypothetical protein
MIESNNELSLYTVYENPFDYPGKFVVRRFEVFTGATDPNPLIVCDTLEEVRAVLPPGLVCLPRHPDDDPVILETWL